MPEGLRSARVVVVGAGMGGLVSALLLARRGVHVTLVEAAATPGGKMHQVDVDGAAIDAGPTVFTMRWVFDEITEQAGLTPADLPRLTPLPVLARHAWRGRDGTLDLHADADRTAAAIGELAGAAEARRFEAFCRQARAVYQHLEQPYLRGERPGVLSLTRALGPAGLAALAGLGPFASLAASLARQFRDERLRQLFARYATYCGSSPWQAPATLMLVAQVEMDGVWSVDGGMHGLARCLAEHAGRAGATLRYGCECKAIVVRHGQARGVRLAGGEELAADAVVFNGEPQALAGGLLGPEATRAVPRQPRARRSLSALTWAIRARTSGFALDRHNVFFDCDYRSEFEDIFARRRLPRHGTAYVCAQDRGSLPPPGGAERLLCLVNAPAEGDQGGPDDEEIDACERRTRHLLQDCGLRIDWDTARWRRCGPRDFHCRFPTSGGALYGQSTHGWMAPFRRPTAASALPGLFLAGGSVHPGPGVPMAALSGWRSAEAVMAHLGSTRQWHPVPTSGGTSTPSATTAAMP